MSKTIAAAWTIPIPQLPTNPFNFQTTISVNGSLYIFEYRFYQARWHLWVTFPDLQKREAGIFPNVTSWTGYLDYGLFIKTDLDFIGQNDLDKITILLLKWGI